MVSVSPATFLACCVHRCGGISQSRRQLPEKAFRQRDEIWGPGSQVCVHTVVMTEEVGAGHWWRLHNIIRQR